MKPWTRRSFLTQSAAVAAATASPASILAAAFAPTSPKHPPTFLDLIRPPDLVTATLDTTPQPLPLHRSGTSWQAPGIDLRTTPTSASTLDLTLSAPNLPLKQLRLRWQTTVALGALYLGDAWERSYGDLAWRSITPERVLPWYFAAHTPTGLTDAYGVLTGARALCFWQVDTQGVSLTLDVSNGGNGVLLGQRELHAATVLTRPGQPGERPDQALAVLCRLLCPTPRLPRGPIYGANDWYYAYGRNSADGILRDTDLVASLAPTSGPHPFSVPRPFSVIDGGWEPDRTPAGVPSRNPAFPDMPRLAEQIRGRGARPGIWIRPTQAPTGTAANLLLPNTRFKNAAASDSFAALDPTLPEALDILLSKVREVTAWRYELIKHDYSTYDLLGQWGFDMGASPTRPGWHFHDRSRTNAEILLHLYQSIRSAAGDQTLLLGCNTVGHLGAGLFELQRTGDDTSGRLWERTRRMGVNTLAFRLPQNRTFFLNDADCVGITRDIPWQLNRQWLDLLARSGTALFLSPAPDAIGPDQRQAIQQAFAIAAAHPSTAQTSTSEALTAYPTDALEQTTPEHWAFPQTPGAQSPGNTAPDTRTYTWCPSTGCDPGSI